jgi:hypothetical protein
VRRKYSPLMWRSLPLSISLLQNAMHTSHSSSELPTVSRRSPSRVRGSGLDRVSNCQREPGRQPFHHRPRITRYQRTNNRCNRGKATRDIGQDGGDKQSSRSENFASRFLNKGRWLLPPLLFKRQSGRGATSFQSWRWGSLRSLSSLPPFTSSWIPLLDCLSLFFRRRCEPFLSA